MANRIRKPLEFPRCKGRKGVEAFDGGALTPEGGVLLPRQVDRRLGLLKQTGRVIPDPRREASSPHDLLSMPRRRVYGIAPGHEDLNDHATLRGDPALRTGVDRDEALASAPALCRMENAARRQAAWAIHQVLVEQFIASFTSAPEELLDFDATDDPVHGDQEGRFFHGHYDEYCFPPLYVFRGERLLVSYPRPASPAWGAAHHALAVLKLLVQRLRAAWPNARIVPRGDSDFCKPSILAWCDRKGVDYIVGLAKNKRLNTLAGASLAKAERRFAKRKQKVRLFTRAVARLRHSELEAQAPGDRADRARRRGFQSPLSGHQPGWPGAAPLRAGLLRAGREGEPQQGAVALFFDRTSCHHWWPNQFRLLLSSRAYPAEAGLEALRRLGLHGTALARAQVESRQRRDSSCSKSGR